MNDKINDVYGFFYASSNFVAPLIGSNLYLSNGASETSKYISTMNMGFLVFYFIFNCGFTVFRENKKFKMEL